MKKGRQRTPRARAARPTQRRWHAWIAPGVAVATFVAFAPSLLNQFVDWDDFETLAANPSYRGLAVAQLKWMWTTVLLGHYVPVTWMTFGIDYLLWGLNPAGYHLTNMLLHSANAAALYVVVWRLLNAAIPPAREDDPLTWRLGAALAALLFALHPLRVESVAWATERRDVLSGLFYLLAILAYLRDADSSTGVGLRRRPWYWVALGSFVLALLSKAIVVTLPIVLLVLDVYPLQRMGSGAAGWWSPAARRRWAEKLPFVLASAVVIPVALVAARAGANLVSIGKFGIVDRLSVSLYGLAFYLWKTIVPLDLTPFYPLRTPVVPLSAPYIVSGLVVAAITGLVILVRRSHPGLGAVWLVYVVTLFPMSGIFQNGPQVAADRYSYLPSLALAVLAGAGAVVAWRAWTQRRPGRVFSVGLTGVAALLVTTLAVLTWKQVGVWRDSERLWSHALTIAPASMVFSHLADLRRQQGRWAEANEFYQRAVQLRPDGSHILVHWGTALAQQGKLAEAIDRYREALRIDTDIALPHYHWGNALLAAGDPAGAIAHYREAVRLEPKGAEALSNWGRALALLGQRDAAIAKYREALAIRPLSVPHYNWGNALFVAGELDEAIVHYREAIRLEPGAVEAYNNWGQALARQGRWEEAIARYREALRLKPDYALASANLDHALTQVTKTRGGEPQR
jgi:protein O-mannosyl-transferase